LSEEIISCGQFSRHGNFNENFRVSPALSFFEV
jgi:hypothetical protein